MRNRTVWTSCVLVAVGISTAGLSGQGSQDFGRFVERELRDRAPALLGIDRPLQQSALGPFSGDAASAIEVANNLKVRVVSPTRRRT